MNNFELAAKCVEIALKHKTLYVLGGFGAPLTASMKRRVKDQYAYNNRWDRRNRIDEASSDTFAFDCCGLIKAVLWGWKGDLNAVYGGAQYYSNNVPDVGADEMIRRSLDVSAGFTGIQIGEAVWMDGHIGVYIGNGLAVECSPKWADGVQITAVENVGAKKGYNGRRWTKHGKLPWVRYCPAGDINFDGRVTSEDARLALRAAVELEKPTEAQKLSADVTGDGRITAEDAREILRKSVGKGD